MTSSCAQCVFDRLASLDDEAVVRGVDRCGGCPRLGEPVAFDLVARARRFVQAREAASAAGDSGVFVQGRARNAMLRLMSTIASVANAATDAGEMLTQCLRPLCAAVGMGAGFIIIGEIAGAAQVVRAREPAAVEAALLRLARCAWVRELQGATWPRAVAVQAGGAELQAAAEPAGLRRVLAIPVLVEGEVQAHCVLVDDEDGPEEPLTDIVAAAQDSLSIQLGQVLSRQRAVEAHRQARKSAESASRAKSEFVAGISHELRTPLSAILGYGELLAEDFEERGDADASQTIARMNGASRHLLGLINNVLDLSKIEAGKMEVVREPVDVEELLADVVATLTPMVEDRGNRLLRRGTAVPHPLVSDPTKLRQILFNLIGNAAKFTKLGTITVTSALTGGDGEMALHLAVEDTGIGMTEAQIARIFEAFTQAEAATASRYGGTGLGLTLCKRLTELLGGSIRVASTPGVGSRFVVEMPAVPAPSSGA